MDGLPVKDLYLLIQFLLSVDLQGLVALLLLSDTRQVLLRTFLQHILILMEKQRTVVSKLL